MQLKIRFIKVCRAQYHHCPPPVHRSSSPVAAKSGGTHQGLPESDFHRFFIGIEWVMLNHHKNQVSSRIKQAKPRRSSAEHTQAHTIYTHAHNKNTRVLRDN